MCMMLREGSMKGRGCSECRRSRKVYKAFESQVVTFKTEDDEVERDGDREVYGGQNE